MSEKIIPHMCLICNRNTSGCDRVAFYSAEGELAGSALVEYSANVLMSRSGALIPADNRLKDCRIKFEYADEIEDVLPTSFQTLIKKTHDDVKAAVAVVDLNADELFRGDLQAFERFWIRNGDEASGMATLHDWLVARYYVNSEAANTEALKQQWQQAIPSNYVSCTKSLTPRCRSWSTTFPGPARARP